MASLNINLDTPEFKQALKDRVIDIGEQIFANSQKNIIDMGLVDRGTLLNSGEFIVNDDSVEIRYNVNYADIIEFGRNPGSMPHFTPIFEWVQRKLGVSDKKKAKSIAFAVMQDIKKNGLEPRPYLSKAIEQARLSLK